MSDTLNLNAPAGPPASTPAPSGDVLDINAKPKAEGEWTPPNPDKEGRAMADRYFKERQQKPPIVPSDNAPDYKDFLGQPEAEAAPADAPAATTEAAPEPEVTEENFDFSSLSKEFEQPQRNNGDNSLSALWSAYDTAQDPAAKEGIRQAILRLSAPAPQAPEPRQQPPIPEPVAQELTPEIDPVQEMFNRTFENVFREMAESRNITDIATGTLNFREALVAAMHGKPILMDPSKVTDQAQRNRIIQMNNRVQETVRDLQERAQLRTESRLSQWETQQLKEQLASAKQQPREAPSNEPTPTQRLEQAFLSGVETVAAKMPPGLRERASKVLSTDNPLHKQAATLMFDRMKELHNTLPKDPSYDIKYLATRAVSETLASFPNLIPRGANAPQPAAPALTPTNKVVDNGSRAVTQQPASGVKATPTSLPPSAGTPEKSEKPTVSVDISNPRDRQNLAMAAAKAYAARQNR